MRTGRRRAARWGSRVTRACPVRRARCRGARARLASLAACYRRRSPPPLAAAAAQAGGRMDAPHQPLPRAARAQHRAGARHAARARRVPARAGGGLPPAVPGAGRQGVWRARLPPVRSGAGPTPPPGGAASHRLHQCVRHAASPLRRPSPAHAPPARQFRWTSARWCGGCCWSRPSPRRAAPPARPPSRSAPPRGARVCPPRRACPPRRCCPPRRRCSDARERAGAGLPSLWTARAAPAAAQCSIPAPVPSCACQARRRVAWTRCG